MVYSLLYQTDCEQSNCFSQISLPDVNVLLVENGTPLISFKTLKVLYSNNCQWWSCEFRHPLIYFDQHNMEFYECIRYLFCYH